MRSGNGVLRKFKLSGLRLIMASGFIFFGMVEIPEYWANVFSSFKLSGLGLIMAIGSFFLVWLKFLNIGLIFFTFEFLGEFSKYY